MLSFAAFVEAPDALRACASAGECNINENGVHGLDNVRLAEMVTQSRVKVRALRCAFATLRLNDWVVV